VARAIVWQDRRTTARCEQLRRAGQAGLIQRKTGLVLDAYFSATKLEWLLDEVPGARAREAGELAFGTVDSWLIFKLTGGRVHATDPSNAARTLLMDIHTLDWDDELLRLFHIPRALLPRIVPSSGVLGESAAGLLGAAPIPIAGVAGDQQAATFGQACFAPGMAKNTYGTGCFMLMNTGTQAVASRNRLLSTVGWQGRARRERTARPTVLKDRCSWPAPRCSGCATAWASSTAPPPSSPGRQRARHRRRLWCPPLPAWARPTGTAARAAPWWA
jgi:glycerol kinase